MSFAAWQFDNYDLTSFTTMAAGFGCSRFGYVVTPNTDHLLRLHDDEAFRALYSDAGFVLLDSRFLAHLLRFFRGIRLPVCAGSDLTERLLSTVVSPGDSLILIGGSDQQAKHLSLRYGLTCLAHFNPPMGFAQDPFALERCLTFIEDRGPFRFCFLAVGSPQQEQVAQQLKHRSRARGLALCIGASINFLTGVERRAPRWMQRLGLEWLHRLCVEPGRMAHRYLVRGPRIFGLLRRATFTLRSADQSKP